MASSSVITNTSIIKPDNKLILPNPPSTSQKSTQPRAIDYFVGICGMIVILIWILIETPALNANRLVNLILILGALALLFGASNVVLDYAVKLSEYLGISELIIGLTIVSIGTSFPEMFTSMLSAARGVGSFVLGDIYGSYITQLTAFLGMVVLAAPFTVNRKFVPHVKRDGGLMLAALLFLSFNISDGHLTRLEAIISISIFIGYILYLYISAKRNPKEELEDLQTTEHMELFQGVQPESELHCIKEAVHTEKCPTGQPLFTPFKRSPLKVIKYLSIILIATLFCYLGAIFVVQSGSNLARSFNISEHVIGATIVGFGTGFPEFVVSFMALKKKKIDIAYGNLLGSNIVDPLLSISLGVLIRPIEISPQALNGILGILLPIAIIVDLYIIFIFNRKNNKHWQGILFGILFLGLYLTFLLLVMI